MMRESLWEEDSGLACLLMFIHGLCKVAPNDGRFLTGVKSDFHSASGLMWAVRGQTGGRTYVFQLVYFR